MTAKARRITEALVAAVMCAVAVCVGAWVVRTEGSQVTSIERLCGQYFLLRSRLSLAGPDAQFGLRPAAARLARLAADFPESAQRNAMPARRAATTIDSVLRVPYATVFDLWTATRPVAVACGEDVRTSSSIVDLLHRRQTWG